MHFLRCLLVFSLFPPPSLFPLRCTYNSPFLGCHQSAFTASAALFVNLVYTLSTCGITNSCPVPTLPTSPHPLDHLSPSLTTGRGRSNNNKVPINMLLKHVPVVSRQALSTPECLFPMPIPIPSPFADDTVARGYA